MYAVGGLRVKGLTDRYIPTVVLEQSYSEFISSESAGDVEISLLPVDALSQRVSQPVYSDTRNRVYAEEGKFYRYQGTLLHLSPENWRSCLVVNPCQPDRAEVYLSREREPMPESKLLGALGLDYLLALRGKVLLHAAYICHHGKGVLFTAPSGTGKSTQAELWRVHRPGTQVINGDRAVFAVEGGIPTAHGFPFCGSSGITHNISSPLRAIVVLRQGEKNRLERLSGARAATLLLSQSMLPVWDAQATQRVINTVTQVVEYCPIYLYHCRPDLSAVDLLWKVIFGGGTQDE